MYDAKKLPLRNLESHFKDSLDSIATCLRNMSTISKFDGELMQKCAQKIIDRVHDLPVGEATEMLEGLSQIINIVSSRINEVDILTRFMTDPEYVPSANLAKIALHPLLQTSCNLPEVLIPCVPNHLLPEECRS